ncbi:hypothetical protein KC19_5G028300 [Ceratodon purpureus]|uniref:Autophagy-related protein 14 n=1 Tax=Ceratodon purpureus TaxID=3225 RepID=A0A8T0HXD1_CERPU|nr:hypothetical protein KC19_5G028300 [Ceratodon purpureus]
MHDVITLRSGPLQGHPRIIHVSLVSPLHRFRKLPSTSSSKFSSMARRSCVCGICDTPNLASVCTTCINHRLMERYKLVKTLVQERDVLRRRLDEELIAKREAELQQHWRVEHVERRAQLKERLRQCKEELAQGKTKRDQAQNDLDTRTQLLSAASAQLAKRRADQFLPDFIRAQSLSHTSSASELYQKRRMIFRQLCKILPLRRSSVTVEERQKWEGSINGQQSVRICGARLPIGDDPLSTPHTELAASLGYLVQLVNMSARYLSGPLLHSSGFAASSSRVWQRASYFDSKPASRSEEFPLFLPRQNGRGHSGDEGNELSKSVGSNLGFSSMESPRIETVESTASLVNYGTSSGTRESYPDVQKGIKLLRRSVGCLCAYGFGHLSLSIPSDMPILDTFAELLNTLSSKEIRSRSSRGNQQPNGRFGLSEGPLARWRRGLPSLSDGNRISIEPLGGKAPIGGVTSWNDPENSYSDSENEAAPNSSDNTVDGWNLVEHPRLPPPPSHSEDVEHWTRAMFIDVTR